MDLALVLTGLLMGMAGAPHCAAMCGAACSTFVGAPSGRASDATAGRLRVLALGDAWWFHGARVASYAAAGAAASAGVALLSWAGHAAPLLRPLWTLLHMAALSLGLWLAITGRQPDWVSRWGRARPESAMRASTASWKTLIPAQGRQAWRAAAVGGMWALWPCGLLQSAVVVAGLTNTILGGAAVMMAFALSSAVGLQVLPSLWNRWVSPAAGQRTNLASLHRLAVRLAGVLLAAGSMWAMGHETWGKVWDYCVSAFA